jgi:FtsP/CotA-like multicopper oxidase with cupredoxin domain
MSIIATIKFRRKIVKTRKILNSLFSILIVCTLLLGSSGTVSAQNPPPPAKGTNNIHKGRVSPADRQAAAVRAAKDRANSELSAQAVLPQAGGMPDYFGITPNYANSPIPASTSIIGDGVGALATVTVSGGVVTDVVVTNGGVGYTVAATTVTIVGGGGTGATVGPITVNANGAILSPIPVINGGSGYNTTVNLGGIRKFVDTLPGINAPNNLGNSIPVAVPEIWPATATAPEADYYVIALQQYTQKMHSDLPPTTLRGYVQLNGPSPAPISYLGPLIIAQKDRPVRIKFINQLPTGTGGNLFIPVDTTVMGAGMGPNGGTEVYKENRATLHLHGGNTPWISDGTPHQWTTPAGETTSYPEGVSVYNVPDMDGGVEPVGTLTFYYTNQQSARLMFYHDHTYGTTRLNVYAGEAAAYIIQDPVEQAMVNGGCLPDPANCAAPGTITVNPGTIPQTEIPLVIQDKTFVDANEIGRQDPTWNWGSNPVAGPVTGDLWFPHVYMPNQNPYDMFGVNAMGRWDYGPWFWPPFTVLANGPVPNPLFGTTPEQGPVNPGTPNPSLVPEGYMDTMVVNGTVYPVLKVAPQAYRFRILNASNDRFVNLQLYKAKSNADMWNPDGTLADANAGEVNMVPAVPNAGLPRTWPTDGRDGGVPDPLAAGPSWLQIGTEGGFLPGVAVIPPTPIGYDYNRRSIVVLNVLNKSLFLGPAERADVIVDFSALPVGTKLILYNDAPAPVPAFDPRNDYYTGGPDNTNQGGAPSTLPGFGPNTRTIMQIQVDGSVPITTPTFVQADLVAALPVAYAATQPAPLVPQAAYNTAFGATNYPANAYVKIQDNFQSFFNGPLPGISVVTGGSGYLVSAPPTITIGTEGGGTGAVATPVITGAILKSLSVATPGSAYTSAPKVVFTGGGGTGAAGVATITKIVARVSVTGSGSGYLAPPTVKFTGGGGTGAAATATVTGGKVTGVQVTNPGSGYTSNPTVSFTPTSGGTGAKATAAITGIVNSVTLTSPGTGYASPPVVTLTGGAGTGATATLTSTLGVITGITVTNGGTKYTSAPTITIACDLVANPLCVGSGATAAAVPLKMALQPKAIQELFTLDYGRMNATLGVEIPSTTGVNQTTIPFGYVDPATEVMSNTADALTPIGTAADGTQLWKITHNGVDSHAIHWHMFNVQLINRVGWDGQVRVPDANELGWKETIRMNPLEDIIVALRPIIPTVP